MTRKAIVAAVGESWIELLSLDETERAHDESCGGGGSCGSGGCGCRVSGHPFRAEIPRKLKIHTGDTVEVSSSASRALAASLVVFGVPLLFGAGAWILLLSLAPSLNEGARVGISAVALALGGGLIAAVGSRSKGKKLPTITAVVDNQRQAG